MSIREHIYSLLRKSEQYLKTDMVYLTHGGFWLTLWQTSTALSSLAIAVAFAYLLPKEVFGNYKYILSLAAIAGSLSLTGLGGAVTQAVAQGFEQTLSAAFRANFRWGMFVTATSWVMAAYYFINENNTIATALFFIGIILPFLNNFLLYGAFLSGKKYFKENALKGIVLGIVPAVAVISTFFITNNAAFLAIIFLFSSAVVAGLFYFLTVRTHRPVGGVSLKALSYGKHASVMGVVGVVAVQIESVLIFHYLGAAELAAYALALAFPQHIWNLFRNVSTLALPKFSEKSFVGVKFPLTRKIFTLSLAAGIITALYVFLAPLLFEILFPQYTESVLLSQVLSISLLGIASVIPLTALQASLKKKRMYAYTFVSNVFHIVVALISIPIWGLWGAVAAYIAARLFSLALSIFLTRTIETGDKFDDSSKNTEDEIPKPMMG